MSSLEMKIPHSLPRKEAIRRTRAMLEELKQEWGGSISNLEERWVAGTNRFSFEIMGSTISGVLVVEDSKLTLTWKIPILLTPFKNNIETKLREKITCVLAP